MDLNILSVIVVAIAAPVSGLVLAYLTGRERRKEKQQDWDRQDLVAERAEQNARAATAAANLVALQAAETAKLLLIENKRAAAVAIEIKGQVTQIHTLVNSNMTASIQSELDTTILLHTSIQEVLCLQKLSNHEPAPDTIANLELAQTKITRLRKVLAERAAADDLVEKQKLDIKQELREL